MIAMKCTALDARISFVNFENSSESPFPLIVDFSHVNFGDLNLLKPSLKVVPSHFKLKCKIDIHEPEYDKIQVNYAFLCIIFMIY